MYHRPLNGVRLYLLGAATCVLSGWALSALHWLTPAGYAVALPVVLISLAWLTRDPAVRMPSRSQRRWGPVMCRRFRRPLPLIFLMIVVLVFAGAVSHAPNNYDGLTYRLPRMLNWLSTRGWTWIVTNNDRMNYSGTGWEWMALPLLALRSDRALFLVDAAGFLLLPGLIFSVFRQAGVARRAAWAWMWILPAGFGYALQAGSIGNDLTGAVFCLISVHYGLRARRRGRVEEVWLAGLAAAILTGIKASNLPLLLPCAVAIGPALVHLRRRWAAGILLAAVMLAVSIVPTVVLNLRHTGSWTGDPDNRAQLELHHPGAALLGNSLLLSKQLLMPPLLPGARPADAWLSQHLPEAWRRALEKDFPRYFMDRFNELPQEEAASLGIGITLLLLTAVGAAVYSRITNRSHPASCGVPGLKLSCVGWAAWMAGLVFMIKMGSEADARLMLPYYPLMLIPVLVLPGQDRLVRRTAWRMLALLVSLSVLPCLVLTPSRPLWPVETLSGWLSRHHPESSFTRRLTTVYSCYQTRNDLLAPLRARLPDNATNIGFIAGVNDSDYSLWRPFGQRRVTCLRDDTRPLRALPTGLEWLVVRRSIWPEITEVPLEAWAFQHRMEIVDSVPIRSFASTGEETWCLLHVQKP